MSGKHFDFFIPGYYDFNFFDGESIKINEKKYYFNKKLFDDFFENLESDFGIKYSYNPMLIIMAMKKANKESAQYIVIELDDYSDSNSVRKSGELFRKIFDIAENNPDLLNIRNNLVKTYIQGNFINSIIEIIGNDSLKEIHKNGKELKRFTIKHS